MSDERPQVVDKRRFNNLEILESEDVNFEPLQFSPSAKPDSKHGLMDFTTAIKSVLEGKRVTRLEWGNPDVFLFMFMWGRINPNVPAGKYLSIHNADGNVHPLYMNDGDMLGEDWVEVV